MRSIQFFLAIVGTLMIGIAQSQAECPDVCNMFPTAPDCQRCFRGEGTLAGRPDGFGGTTYDFTPNASREPAPTYQEPAPLVVQTPSQATPPASPTNPILSALEWLGKQVSSGAPLPEGVPLSTDLGTALNVKPPGGYSDPFQHVKPPAGFFNQDDQARSSASRGGAKETGTGANINPFTGTVMDLKPRINQPANSPAANSSGPPGSYAACVGSNTFGTANPPSCEMGGWVYFANGSALKN
jgi:hypothetical protein